MGPATLPSPSGIRIRASACAFNAYIEQVQQRAAGGVELLLRHPDGVARFVVGEPGVGPHRADAAEVHAPIVADPVLRPVPVLGAAALVLLLPLATPWAGVAGVVAGVAPLRALLIVVTVVPSSAAVGAPDAGGRRR